MHAPCQQITRQNCSAPLDAGVAFWDAGVSVQGTPGLRVVRFLPMANETISLKTKFSNGTGGEGKLYHFAGGQLDAEGQPLASPPTITATSNQSSYVGAFTNATDANVAVGDVDIRAVGKAPGNIASALVTIKDGRTVNGVDVKYEVEVAIVQNPDISAIAPTSSEAIRSL